MGCYADSRLCPQTRPSTLLCQEEFCVLISILCSPFILSFNSNELYWHECNNKIAKASYIQHTSFSLSVVLSLSHLSHCIFFSWFMQAEIRRSKRDVTYRTFCSLSISLAPLLHGNKNKKLKTCFGKLVCSCVE